jgi:hypothetical protein
MATHMIAQPETDWADARRTTTDPSPAGSGSINTPANYASNAALDTRLLAIGGIYTQRYVDSMTQNDKVYAVRLADDTASIKP